MTDTLRSCIISESGYTLISLDASQIELRVLAILSQDPQLLEDLKAEDLHLATAIRMYGWTDDEEEMKKRRYKAKQGNFADIYGIEDEGLAELLECSLDEVLMFREDRRRIYPRVYEWMEEVKAKAREDGFVVNIFGRIRPLPELYAGSFRTREAAEKKVVNTLCQGTAVDIVKIAGLHIRNIIDTRVRFVLQVHDEWLLECPDELLEQTISLCQEELPQAFPDYPFSIATGKCYGELKEVKNESNLV